MISYDNINVTADFFLICINELININTVLYGYFVCYEIQFSDNRINIASYEQRDELWLVNIIAVFFQAVIFIYL